MKPIAVKKGVPREMKPGDNPTLDEWLKRVDAFTFRCRGVSLFDLPDCPFAEWHEQRLRPIHAANKALRRAGAFDE